VGAYVSSHVAGYRVMSLAGASTLPRDARDGATPANRVLHPRVHLLIIETKNREVPSTG
jgi:hypothetical protein